MILNFPDFKVVSQHKKLLHNIHTIQLRLSRFDKFKDRTIFSSAHSSDGLKITKFRKDLILDYLNSPNINKWDVIYKYQITPNKSLWDAWNKGTHKKIISVKNSENLCEKWTKIPEPQELVRGIKILIENERKKLEKSLETLEFEHSILFFKYRNYLRKYA